MGAVALRHDDQAARVLVQPMHNPGAFYTTDARETVAAMSYQCVHERSGGLSGAGVDGQTGRFVDYEEALILKDDVERNIFAHERDFRRLRHRDAEYFRRFDPVGGVRYRRPRCAHQTVQDKVLDSAPGEVWQGIGERPVEPYTGFGRHLVHIAVGKDITHTVKTGPKICKRSRPS